MYSDIAYTVAVFIEPIMHILLCTLAMGLAALWFLPNPGYLVWVGDSRWLLKYVNLVGVSLSGCILLSTRQYLALGSHTFLHALAAAAGAAMLGGLFCACAVSAMHLSRRLVAYQKGAASHVDQLRSQISSLEKQLRQQGDLPTQTGIEFG